MRRRRPYWGVLYAMLAVAVAALVVTAALAGTLRLVAQCVVCAAAFAGICCWLRANRRMLTQSLSD